MKIVTLAALSAAMLVSGCGSLDLFSWGSSEPEVAAETKAEPQPAPLAPLVITPAATTQSVYTGAIRCDLGATVQVTADADNPGFYRISTGKSQYYMHQVTSRTGAMRLEDEKAGAMWLQLPTKSMLLNQKLGKREADGCVSVAQVEYAARNGSQPSLLGGN